MMFSVVVPVWHTDPGMLGQCIMSILQQSFQDFEILVILDGNDNNRQRSWIESQFHDGRIRIHEIPHGGVAAARNKGMDLARGEYLFFLDADDWYAPGLFAMAAETLSGTNADMLIFDYNCMIHTPKGVRNTPNCLFRHQFVRSGIEKNRLCFGNICRVLVPDMNRHLMLGIGGDANRCYRREMLEKRGVRQDTACAISEDILFNITATAQARTVAYVPFLGENHRIREGSVTDHYDPEVFDKVLPYFEGVKRALKQIPENFYSREKALNTVIVNSYVRAAEQLVYTSDRNQEKEILQQLRRHAEEEPYASAVQKAVAPYFTGEQNLARILLKKKQYTLLCDLIRIKQRRQRK